MYLSWASVFKQTDYSKRMESAVIRPARLPAEAPALAHLLTLNEPDRPMTLERLMPRKTACEPQYFRAWLLAEVADEVVGFAWLHCSDQDTSV